ncbi:MAG: peptidoglycan bridge formation peptidyltransferase VanK-Sc [Marmoricola sp.]
MTSSISVRTIDAAHHEAFISQQPSASFLQVPAWARVKAEWRAESLGWFQGDQLVGVALVLYRDLPKIKRSLAYLPEGPIIDWEAADLDAWLDPMVAHLRRQGAFGIRIGPPVVLHRWSAAQVKEGVADPNCRLLSQLTPTVNHPEGARILANLRAAGWRKQSVEGGFAAGQPPFNFVIPLRDRTPDDVLAGMNQLWRRNIKKADKAGVAVTHGTIEDLPAFHELYVETAARDHFTPRPLSYFTTMYEALNDNGPSELRVYQAHHEGELVASTIWIRVGEHAWYSYGASSTAKRDVRGSNAIQWRMIQDAMAAGAAVYDLRGITETLDSDDPHVGLIQFKVGTGGEAVEYPGEWDLPLNRPLYKAFDLYLRRR